MITFIKRSGYLLVIILICPIITAISVSIPAFGFLSQDNDWIGFLGSYLGGVLTLVGVVLTINHSGKQLLDNQVKSIKPHLVMNAVGSVPDKINGISALYNSYHFQLVEKIGDDTIFYFDKIELIFHYQNIGLGPAIDISIGNLHIGKRLINSGKSDIFKTYKTLTVNNGAYSHFLFDNVNLVENNLDRTLVMSFNDNYSSDNTIRGNYIELEISFDVFFQDMMNNHYYQHAIFLTQITRKQLPLDAHFRFHSISNPEHLETLRKHKR